MALIQYLTRLQFGVDSLASLPAELRSANVIRPLIVTDEGVRKAGLLDRLLRTLNLPDLQVHDRARGDAQEDQAREAAGVYARFGCDGIIGFGGGASLDQAKATAVLVSDDGPLERHAFFRAGMTPSIGGLPPMFLVGTTAGTGAEVNRGCVVRLTSGRKTVLVLPFDSIRCAIGDPALTLTLPPRETAATGIDAISHCIEAYCSPRFNPPADAIALDGLRRAVGALERAVRDGRDLSARTEMQMASIEGALCLQKGLGAVHALSHPLGALGAHHGTLNGILLPVVLERHVAVMGQRLLPLQEALAKAARGSVEQSPADTIRGLVGRVGLPLLLRQAVPRRPDAAAIAALALDEPAHLTNPSPWTEADYVQAIEQAW
jgi:4-hydroxybutyrate dehydrogenase